MRSLPFLVVHSWWLSKVLVVVTTLIVSVAAFAILRVLRRRSPQIKLNVWMTPITIVLGFIAYGCLRTVGHCLLERSYDDHTVSPDRPLPLRVESDDGAVLASAFPGTRDDALRELERWATNLARTEQAVHQRAALVAISRGCGARELLNQAYFGEAVFSAKHCSDETLVDALLFAGRYEEARELATRGRGDIEQRVVAFLGTGAWQEVAALVEKNGARDDHQCFVDLLRIFGGHTAARTRLTGSSHRSLICLLARARSSASPLERERLLRDALDAFGPSHSTAPDRCYVATRQIAWAYGAASSDSVSPSYMLLQASLEAEEPWLATASHGREWLIVKDVLAGSLETAKQSIAETRPAEGEALDLVVSLRSGGEPRTRWRGDDPAGCRQHDGSLLGNGSDAPALTQALERCLFFEISPARVLGLLHSDSHRSELARAAFHAFGRRERTTLDIPFRLVTELAFLRDVSALGGDSERAAELQQSITGHFEAFQDRDRVVALLLWRMLSDQGCSAINGRSS